jgi:chemotaxis protein methyltransferase CheR
LLKDFSGLGTFDVVFCRNVLIYFDQDTKIDVLNRLARQMPEDGFLSLGAAEKDLVTITSYMRPPGTEVLLFADNVYTIFRRASI